MRKLSTKNVKPLKDLVGERMFVLPRSMANSVDTTTGQPCLFVGVNGKQTYIPVETPTPISYNVFCVIKDLGLNDYKTFDEGEEMV